MARVLLNLLVLEMAVVSACSLTHSFEGYVGTGANAGDAGLEGSSDTSVTRDAGELKTSPLPAGNCEMWNIAAPGSCYSWDNVGTPIYGGLTFLGDSGAPLWEANHVVFPLQGSGNTLRFDVQGPCAGFEFGFDIFEFGTQNLTYTEYVEWAERGVDGVSRYLAVSIRKTSDGLLALGIQGKAGGPTLGILSEDLKKTVRVVGRYSLNQLEAFVYESSFSKPLLHAAFDYPRPNECRQSLGFGISYVDGLVKSSAAFDNVYLRLQE